MSPKAMSKLIKQLKAAGVSYYKHGDLELHLGPAVEPKLKRKPAKSLDNNEEISPEKEAEIKHKLEELTSIMQLDDQSLLDRLFPDTEPTSDEVAQ